VSRAAVTARDALLADVSEKAFEAQVVRQAKGWGWTAYKDVVAWRSDPGWPDLVMLRRGRLVVVECKTVRGKLTAAQREWLLAWWESGRCDGPYVWTPACWGEIARILAPDGVGVA
jgi:hypothetical protein